MAKQLLGILIGLVLLGILFGLLQRRWPAVVGLRRSRSELATDLVYWLLTPLLTKPLTRIVVGSALLPLPFLLQRPVDRAGLLHGFGPAARMPVALQVLAIIVLGDLIGYWTHRAFHCRQLWRFHAVHHAARELTWLSATRLHPLNDAVSRLAQALPFVLLGFAPMVVAAYVPLLTLHALLLHANLRWDFGPLRLVISSPAFHRWHHADEPAARDRNFAGLLPLWDRLFGTLYLPVGQHPQSFGVNEEVPNGVLAQWLYPFRSRPSAISATPPRITAIATRSNACTASPPNNAPTSTATGGFT